MLYGPTGQRVLVVDDESQCSRLLVKLLTPEFHVDVAGDGEVALTTINLTPPDIVLLDVGLPGQNGIEVCRAIKRAATTRLIPVVLLTGMSGREHRLAGIDAGADDFLEKPFDAEQLKARVRSLTRLKRFTDELESAESVILSLALTVEARDPYTEGHCERLASYAVALGSALGLSGDDLAALNRGGFLHDVGKVGIPDHILLKPGRLDSEEFSVMKTHTTIGYETLQSASLHTPRAGYLRMSAEIARHHHEKWDGSGYPDGLRGEEIPLAARIVAVADVYDALISKRVYKAAFSHEQAMAIIAEGRGAHFDPRIADVFLNMQDTVKSIALSLSEKD